MSIRQRTFAGGYRFKRFEGRPGETLAQAPLPRTVAVPLWDPQGGALPPLVQAGAPVRAGQILARDDESLSSPVLAPVSGTVKEVRDIEGPQGKVPTALIEGDGEDGWEKLPVEDWRKAEAARLEERLYTSGVTVLGESGLPTRFRSAVVSPGEVEHVIVQDAQAEPYNAAPAALLGGRSARELAAGLEILKRIFTGARFHLAAAPPSASLLGQIAAALGDPGWLDLYRVRPKYPQGRQEVLVRTVLGGEYPFGYPAIHLGVVVLDLQAVLQAYEAVAEGKPLIERVITLSGPGFSRNLHLRARIATPVGRITSGYLREGFPVRLVLDSALTGAAIAQEETPLPATARHLIALREGPEVELTPFAKPGFRADSYSSTFASAVLPVSRRAETNLHGELRPCISCGYCAEVCPVQIMPNVLHRYVQRRVVDEELVRLRLFNCIDCNLCSYVCPSKLPLAALMQEGKELARQDGLDPTPGAAARLRLKGLAGPAGEERAEAQPR